jgi:hypothetical protein
MRVEERFFTYFRTSYSKFIQLSHADCRELCRLLRPSNTNNLGMVTTLLPITVAEWSKAWTVFARSDRGFESHSGHGCLVYVFILCCVVLCLGRGLATSWSLVQRVLPSVKMIMKLKGEARAHGGCRASEKKNYRPSERLPGGKRRTT